MVALGASTASSSDEIAEGIQKFSAVARTVGLSYEYAASALATLTANTRESADVVGNALKTLFSRIQGLKVGETLDDGTDLNKYSEALASIGVNIKDVNGNLLTMDEILDKTAERWGTLDRAQQLALAQTVAGVRQYNQFVALMENWDDFQENLNTALTSEGALQEQANIYAESWEAARKRVKAAAEDVYGSLVNPDFYIGMDDVLTPFLENLSTVIDAMGGMKGLLITLSALMTQVYGSKIAASIKDMATNLGIAVGYEQLRIQALQQEIVVMDLADETNRGMDEIESYRIGTMQKYINLQSQLITETPRLTELQKQNVQADLELVNQLQNEMETRRQAAEQAQQNVDRLSDTIQNMISTTGEWESLLARAFDELDRSGRATDNIRNLLTSMNQSPNRDVDISTLVERLVLLERQAAIIGAVRNQLRDANGDLMEVENISQRTQLALTDLAQTFGLINERSDFTILLNNLRSGAFDNIQPDIDALRVVIGSLAVNSDRATNAMNRMTPAARRLGLAQGDLEMSIRNTDHAIDEMSNRIVTGQYRIKEWADRLVTLANGLSRIGMSINSIRNIGRVFTNEDMSNTDRLVSLFTSLGMLIPTVSMALKSLNFALEAQVVIEGEHVAILGQSIVAERARQKLNALNTAGMSLSNQAIRANNILLATQLSTIGGILAAIVALTGAIYLLVKAYNADVDALKEAIELQKKMTDEATKAKQAYQELINTIKEYDEAVDALKELTEGTNEYKEAVEKANEKAQELLKSNTGLQAIAKRDPNGLISFDKQNLEKYQDRQKQYMSNAQMSSYIAEINSNNASIKSDLTNLKRSSDHFYSNIFSDSELNTLASTIFQNEGIITEDDLREIVKELPVDMDYSDLKNAIMSNSEDLIKLGQSMDEVAKANEFLANEIARAFLDANDEDFSNRTEDEKTALSAMSNRLISSDEAQEKEYELRRYYNEQPDSVARNEYAALMGWNLIKGGRNKATYLDENLEEKVIPDDIAWEEVIQSKILEELLTKGTESRQELEETFDILLQKSQDIEKTLGTEGLVSEILGFVSDDSIFDNLTELSPEQIDKLKLTFETLPNELGLTPEQWSLFGYENGEAFGQSLMDALAGYDVIEYYRNQIEEITAESKKIDSTLLSYQKGEDLDDDQLAYLTTLEDKYEELNRIQIRGSHEYLATLREIREANEANTQENLRGIEAEQQARVNELQEEIRGLKELRDRSDTFLSEENKIKLEADTEELEKTLAELMETKRTITVEVDADIQTDVDDAFGLAAELSKLKDLVATELTITFDRAQELIAQGYGAILVNAQETSENLIKLDKDVMNNFIDSKQGELNADRKAKITQLENEKQVLISKRNSLDQGLQALAEVTKDSNEIDKASALAKALLFEQEAKAKGESANKQMEYTEKANVEISEDAQELCDYLGGVEETNAENSQRAYSDAEKASWQYCQAAISYANQMQAAYVALSDAVRNSATGTATNNPISASKTGSVSVGATGSSSAKGKYNRDDNPIDVNSPTLAKDITKLIEEANVNIDEVIEGTRRRLQAQRDATQAQIGALDAGIAALKSADLSLDKAQSGAGIGKDKKGRDKKDDKKKEEDNTGKILDPEEKKDLEEINERYHEITREIQKQAELLDDISSEVERAYGVNKIRAYRKEQEALNKQLDNQKKKLVEAEHYLNGLTTDDFKSDRTLVEEIFPQAIFDKQSGEILNYTQLLRDNWQIYNNFIDSYNAYRATYSTWTKDQQEAAEAELKDWEARKDLADATYEKNEKALHQYEETLDLRQELRNEIEQLQRDIDDNRLNQIEYRLEVVLQVKNMKDLVRDFSKAIAESFGDAITHGLKAATLSAEAAQAEAALYPEYAKQYINLKWEYENADNQEDRDRIIKDIEDLQGKVIGSGEALLDWIETLDDLLPDAIDAARERFEHFTNWLDHNTTVLDTIKELYALQNVTYKTQEGFERLQRASAEKIEAATNKAALNRAWYENASQEVEAARQKLESLGGNEQDVRWDIYKANYDALLAEQQEAQEAMLSSAQEALDTAREMATLSLERTIYELNQKLSNGAGLDLLQDKYDHYIEKEERYFDKVNEAYQVASWYNKLQKDIDNTSDKAMRDRLKALQAEIDTRREGNRLSQYDLDILNAKYKVLQAQMALEDAQNAKNNMNLVRDRQGNWNYQFTADPDDIADAEQGLIDANIEWYNIAKQQFKDLKGEIISTAQECSDKVQEIWQQMIDGTLTEEEGYARIAELREYYTDKIKYLEEEKNIAVTDMNEAGNKDLLDMAILYGDEVSDLTGLTADEVKGIIEGSGMTIRELLLADNETIKGIVGSNTDLIDLFDNVFARDLDNMTITAGNFETYLDEALAKCENNWQDYNNKVETVADKSGTSLDKLNEYVDDVAESNEWLYDAGMQATEALLDQLEATRQASEGYAELAQQIMGVIEQLRLLAAEQVNYVESKADLDSPDWGEFDDYSRLMAKVAREEGMDALLSDKYKWLFDKRKELIEQRGWGDIVLSNDEVVDILKKDAQGDKVTQAGVDKVIAGEEYLDFFSPSRFNDTKLQSQQQTTNKGLGTIIKDTVSSITSGIGKLFKGSINNAISNTASKIPDSTKISVPSTTNNNQNINIERIELPNVVSGSDFIQGLKGFANNALQWVKTRKS